jgi:hypothetical protein
VDLTGTVPDFYIVPAAWARETVKADHANWLQSKGGTRPRNPDSDHTGVDLDRISQWHRRWDVLSARA